MRLPSDDPPQRTLPGPAGNFDRCRICGAVAAPRPANPAAPFCSPRCKLADLGEWLEARYVVRGAVVGSDERENLVRPRRDEE